MINNFLWNVAKSTSDILNWCIKFPLTRSDRVCCSIIRCNIVKRCHIGSRTGRNSRHNEYLVVYVDDVLIVSHNPQSIVDAISARYDLKGGGAPETYLGATIGKFILPGTNKCTWCMSSDQYLDRAISVVEAKNGPLPTGKVKAPLPTDYHPEIDTSPYLSDDDGITILV